MTRILKLLDCAEEIAISASILIGALILFANVVLRYAFDSGWVWSDELVRYLIIFLTLIGSSVCVRNGSHLVVDALTVHLPDAARRQIRLFTDLTGVLFSLFLLVYGGILASNIRESGQYTPGLEMPTFIPYLAFPIGGGLMALRFVQSFLRTLNGGVAAAGNRGELG